MAERLRKEVLPPPWSYGVTKDGRIFFINDQTHVTTWIHPGRGVPIGTGYSNREDLPRGWQEAITPEGAVYFVDHNEKETSFIHPIKGRTEVESDDLLLLEPERLNPTSAEQTMSSRPSFNVSAKVASPSPFRSSNNAQNNASSPMSPTSPSNGGITGKPSFKARTIPKLAIPTPKRSDDSTIAMEGWLYKQDSGGLKLWKRRWCVISNYCLFYYRGADETSKPGALMLPSYKISPTTPRDKINRKFAFKCEHENMRTYYFAAENQGQMNRWLNAFQLASMGRADNAAGKTFPQNGDTAVSPEDDEDDAGFGEYISRSRQNTATSSQPPAPTSRNGSLKSPRDRTYQHPPHQQNSRGPQPEFDDPRYAAPAGPAGPERPRDRNSSLSSGGSRDQPTDGYGSITGSDRRRPQKGPSPAKRKLYDNYASPDEGAGSRYDPNLDPFADDDDDENLAAVAVDFDQFAKDSVDSYATPSDDDVFPKKKVQPSPRDQYRAPKAEQLQRSRAQPDHAGYPTRRDDDRRPRGPKNDYEDMTGGQRPAWRNGAIPDEYLEMNNLPVDVDQQWDTGSESDLDSETESYSDEEEEEEEEEDEVQESDVDDEEDSDEPTSPQDEPSSPLDDPSSSSSLPPPLHQEAAVDVPSSPRNATRYPPKSPPHTPGQYPASYNTLPRRRSRSRSSSTSKEDGQLSPRTLSSERDPSARPSTLPIPRKQSPREAQGRPRRTSDPHDPSYHSHQKAPSEANPYDRPLSYQDPRGPVSSPPSSHRVSSPSSVSSGSRSLDSRPTHGRDDRYGGRGPDKPPRDQNGNVFQYPKQPKHVEPKSPEQRSFLQSPLVQPTYPVTPEQRVDINSPMTFDGRPQWPKSQEPQHPRDAKQSPPSSQDYGSSDRIVPSIQEPVQGAPQGSSQNGDIPPQKRIPPSYDVATKRSTSRDKLSTSRDHVDIAPSREQVKPSPRTRKRDTLERQELEAGDEFPAMDNQRLKLGVQPTSRFRKWQQKIQPYITLSTGIRLRLSIAGDELLGKSHEELVLLLIQLRRDQANLQCWLEMLDDELSLLKDSDQGSPTRIRYRDQTRSSNQDLTEDQQYYKELQKERDEVETELEISRPLINLVDNLVRMGSLYGGQNDLIAQEFYKDKAGTDAQFPPPKKLIEFSRRREEELLKRDLEDEWNQVQTAEDRQLEDKLNQLHRLDRKLQEISTQVSLLKDEKDKIESSMERLHREMRRSWEDPDRMMSLEEQQKDLKRELVKVRTQLAQGTKELEEITAENAKIEHDVAVLKSKLQNERNTMPHDPVNGGNTTKQKLQMEREVSRVQSLLSNLDQQRDMLKSQMQGIRGDVTPQEKGWNQDELTSPQEEFGHYYSTNLDTMESIDMSPSYRRSQSQTNLTKPTASSSLSPAGRRQIPPSSHEVPSRNAVSSRLNVAPPKGQDWRGSGNNIVGRPSSGSSGSGRHSMPPDTRRNYSPYQSGSPRSQDGYQQSPIQPRRADQLQASPSLPMDYRGSPSQQRRADNLQASPSSPVDYRGSPSQQRRADQLQASPSLPTDYRGSPSQQRRGIDPRLGPAQQQQQQQQYYNSSGQQRQRSGRQSYPEHQAAMSKSRDNEDQRRYRHSAPPDRYRQDYDSTGHSFDRPNSYSSSSMPREKRDHPRQSDPLHRHHPAEPKSSTLPNRKPYTVTDLDTNESQQISPELYDRDPPSGSSSSQKSADTADEYFVTPETRTAESQGAPSYGGQYSTLPGGRDYNSHGSRDYDSQPGHERYHDPNYASRTQSLPHPQPSQLDGSSYTQPSQFEGLSNKPYLVTDLDTKESRNISEVELRIPSSDGPQRESGRRQAPPTQQRSDSLTRVREMQGQMSSPYQGYHQYSSPTNPNPPPPDVVNSPIQDGVYFAMPSPRHSMSESNDAEEWSRIDARRIHSSYPVSTSGPTRNGIDRGHMISKSQAVDQHMAPETSYRHGDGLSSDREVLTDSELDSDQQVRDDLDIYSLEMALKTQEDEDDEDDIQKVRGSEIYRADGKSVEVDESTGGGLSHRQDPYQLTYQQAKRRWARQKFFYPDPQLGIPAKIIIPERYNPLEDESEDETGLSPEERVQRERRVENIQKMLSSHSMPEWGDTDSRDGDEYLHRKVEEEKMMRQEVLVKRRELAAEIKQQTRIIAAKNMTRVGGDHEP